MPETPRGELIIGKWKSVLHRQDGQIDPDAGHREFEFAEDSIVQIEIFDVDGSSDEVREDVWALIDDDEKINFENEGVYDIIHMTADSMTLEYEKYDIFLEEFVPRSDDFLKQ